MAQTLFTEAWEEAGADEHYRPLSGLAVAGFIVSWLSVGAFFGAPLWSIAALAIVLNVAALRHTAVTARKGAGLARAGLVISVLLLSTAVTCAMMHDFLNQRQAQRVADEWIAALLSGDVRHAHQLSTPWPQRQPKDRLAEAYGESPTLRKDLGSYSQIETVRRVVKLQDADATAAFQSATVESDPFKEAVNVEYELRYQEDGQPKTTPLTLQLVRENAYSPHLGGWRVNLYNPVAAPSELPNQEPAPPGLPQ